ncbi:MAG: MurR/RpiR family transcriptional regulator [Dokdonella sp.]|uniref:MurR/RpiR family transcriptional regulator n=3 Tax=Dokdonella sp. TaxID=2291710 RepID=UPI002BE6B9C2|nr:MurR/RpiR family transcriptional regulator [Xanthomonadales bacterium]HQV72405.1 MurR/RpiR family transcriptional regulator [Dokdonella sp.]MBK7210690.1 MurR/RpiR family transcriptional regulator [Xanthomonadales bacterium]MBL0223106.1 MurR/RpiR family transcriptional regulator [Xanthomonadales bacterium]HQW76741.1 MurR/RpiR family transcriptional regulator [Dokdonella sp.]
MSPLLKIRAERDQMSAIERRIADFLLEEAHLLRDYSSQQLANALKISQSSVVKFSQKLGFKGYPDLKYSIGESIARGDAGDSASGSAEPSADDPHAALAENLWYIKTRAEQETRLINPASGIDAIARLIGKAGKVFLIGLGEDGIPARAFAMRLSLLDILTVHHFDAVLMTASISTATKADVLLVFSEHGQQTNLCKISRQFRERHGKVISVTRHSANPLRAHADHSLLVSAHDDRAHIEPLIYHSALRHLLDMIFVLLCESGKNRLDQLESNLERIHSLMEP